MAAQNHRSHPKNTTSVTSQLAIGGWWWRVAILPPQHRTAQYSTEQYMTPQTTTRQESNKTLSHNTEECWSMPLSVNELGYWQ